MNDPGPGTDPESGDDSSESAFADPRGRQGISPARRDAQRALHVLLTSPAEHPDHSVSDRMPSGTPAFEHMALCSDRFIVTVAQPEGRRPEHRLFVAATEDLTDEEYLACIDVSSAAIGPAELPSTL